MSVHTIKTDESITIWLTCNYCKVETEKLNYKIGETPKAIFSEWKRYRNGSVACPECKG